MIKALQLISLVSLADTKSLTFNIPQDSATVATGPIDINTLLLGAPLLGSSNESTNT
jgi:hypothetical protein